ncbi:hypothetical protein ACFV1C_02910 [Streptomyces sp. NPDC059605]|uniref:hypothetical protein n=1 Tax=unclassified Streptomyces TaxID=2593676 RepID=UPI0036C00C2D
MDGEETMTPLAGAAAAGRRAPGSSRRLPLPPPGTPPEVLPEKSGFLRELVLFLSVHLDRAPGVLWPEHEHPGLSGPEWSQVLEGLAAELGPGTPVVARSGGTDDPAAHRVVHQFEGAGTWRLSGARGGRGAEGFRFRLRPGEVLYIPARWSWSVELTPGARYVLTTLATG